MKKRIFFVLNKLLLSVVLVLSLPIACDKNIVVPYVYVYFEIDINQPDMQDLLPVGGKVFVNGGHRGIVIYHSSIDKFEAYDRACTYHPYSESHVIESSKWGVLTCDNCASEYALYADAITIKGPASIALHKYTVTYLQSSQILIISN